METKTRADEFLGLLQTEAALLARRISSDNGDWIVRGFIDVFRRVYTISGDTKVVSKLIELMLLPGFKEFADRNGMKLELARQQNHYPDMTLVTDDEVKFAVDLKSTYRIGTEHCNTMTLGAYSGYFRNRQTSHSTTYPYGEYSGHFVLGVVYDRAVIKSDELAVHTIKELGQKEPVEFTEALLEHQYTCETIMEIPSVVRNLQFFAQPKYRIAVDRPGSGNTRNIGSLGILSQLIDGSGPFASLGVEIFDDYWMNYMTKADAKAAELLGPPYTNLKEYVKHKSLSASPEAIQVAISKSENAEDMDRQPDTEEE